MAFVPLPLAFEPGIFANRSRRASRQRWVDGNLVRFRDGPPQSMGGWREPPVSGASIAGRARDMLAWKMNDQNGRFAVIGTNEGAFLFTGSAVTDITPSGFTAGPADSRLGVGYGSGLYGDGMYGRSSTTTGFVAAAGGWTFDLFGETLLGCGWGDGTIYEYTHGTDTDLTAISGAPKAQAICVSDERHVFAFGCDGNPGMVEWSDREDYSVWTPSSTNRAGFYEMQATSAFQCGKRCRGSVLAWTLTEAFAFSPLANSLVYDRQRIATGPGAMGPHAVTVINTDLGEAAVWMAPDGFYLWDGLTRQIPCDLFDYVFKLDAADTTTYPGINALQGAKVQARTNRLFQEVWFFYCSQASTEIDRAVVWNYANATWTKAIVSRLSWLDQGIFDLPLAVGADGSIYEHESGTTAAGSALGSYVRSAPITIADGQQFAELSGFWPDMEPDSGDCELTIYARDYPGDDAVEFGPYEFAVTDEKIDLEISTRQFEVRIAGVSGRWELGTPQIELQGGSLR
jgi:hypothetical protein